jgi:very-short-patch-repair endonuclease
MEEQIVRATRMPEKQQSARQMRLEMTPAENALWQHLRGNQLRGLHFRRQQVIGGFIADFYCREARLVVECDGQVHHDRKEYDQERDQILATFHLSILRFSNAQVLSEMSWVLEAISQAAQERLREKYQP